MQPEVDGMHGSLQPVLWIRIDFNADPDPGSQIKRIQADTDPGQTLNFLHEVGKTYILKYKSLFERQKTRFIFQFWSISMLLDPDPRRSNECGSMWIRIYNTAYSYSIVDEM